MPPPNPWSLPMEMPARIVQIVITRPQPELYKITYMSANKTESVTQVKNIFALTNILLTDLGIIKCLESQS